MKFAEDGNNVIDIYPVGLLHDWKLRKVRPLRWALRYPVRQATAGNWRAARNYFNGYLAEHPSKGRRAGHGWTKRRAYHDLIRHLAGIGSGEDQS